MGAKQWDSKCQCLFFFSRKNRIFAGAYSNGVYYSSNSGLSWSPSGVNGNWVYALASLDSTIFAGTSFGVFRSTNNGTNWTQTLANTWIYSILIFNNRVFIGTSVGGVFISTDNGVTLGAIVLNQYGNTLVCNIWHKYSCRVKDKWYLYLNK